MDGYHPIYVRTMLDFATYQKRKYSIRFKIKLSVAVFRYQSFINRFYKHFILTIQCLRPIHVEHTGSRPITEVKQHVVDFFLYLSIYLSIGSM